MEALNQGSRAGSEILVPGERSPGTSSIQVHIRKSARDWTGNYSRTFPWHGVRTSLFVCRHKYPRRRGPKSVSGQVQLLAEEDFV